MFLASFAYQAQSWTKPRRVVAKVEWHQGELYPRVGFLMTNLKRPAERVVRFYNSRGTADIYQTSCVPRVRLGQWWRAELSARWACRAQRPQALELVGIGRDQPNGPPLIGRRAARVQQTAPEPAIDRRVGHLQAHRQFQEAQLRRRLPWVASVNEV